MFRRPVSNQPRIGPPRPRLAAAARRLVAPVARRGAALAGLAPVVEVVPLVREALQAGRELLLAGLNIGSHASGAALVRVHAGGQELIANHEEERFTGEKHHSGWPTRSLAELRRTLTRLGRTPDDVLAWTIGWDHVALVANLAGWFAGELPEVLHVLRPGRMGMLPAPQPQVLVGAHRRLARELQLRAPPRLYAVAHHDAHAAFALAASPFGAEPAPVVVTVIDGTGDQGPLSVYFAEGGRLRLLRRDTDIFDSLGSLYAAIATTQGGWPPLSSEGRFMGAAAWGDGDRRSNRIYAGLRRVLHLAADGRVHIDRNALRYPRLGSEAFYGRELLEILGPPIPPERIWHPDAVLDVDTIAHAPITQARVDTAAALQLVFEDAIDHIVAHALRSTGADRLVMAGGTALNCLASMRLLEQFDEDWYRTELGRSARLHLWVPPTPGDQGVAPGAASYLALLAGAPAGPPLPHAFLCGEAPTGREVATALRQAGPAVSSSALPGLDAARLGDLLAALVAGGAVVGLYQGAAETGPRALGHRSILADPTDPDALARVNARVKRREAIRPLAPMVTRRAAEAWFHLADGALDHEAHAYRWMVLTARARPGALARIPAVIHRDGTARLQIVGPDTDPLVYAYLLAMGRRVGVEASVNTSLNVGAPIAQTPEQAVATMLRARALDALLMVPADGAAVLAWPAAMDTGAALAAWRASNPA